MSISQKIDQLKEHVDADGQELLQDLNDLVTPYEPGYHLNRLAEAILSKEEPAEENPKRIHELVDALHSSTARYSRPESDRFTAFKKDLGRFFTNCHKFIDLGMFHAVFEYTLLYHSIFSEPKKICSLPRFTCHTEGCEGRFPEPEGTVCPECSAYRALCKNPPASNGRCRKVPSHGGQTISGPLSDRAKSGRVGLYRKSLNGELERMYIEAVTDVDYLSVSGEMGALAARSAELLSLVGGSDVDYLSVSVQVQQSVRKLRRAVLEHDLHEAESEATTIETLLTRVGDDKRRWDEIAALSGRLGRLAETERKRIIESQKMITVQEMYMLREETLGHIRDAAGVVATELVKLLGKGVKPDRKKIRTLILSTLHAVTKGDIDVDYYLDKGEALEEGVVDGELSA